MRAACAVLLLALLPAACGGAGPRRPVTAVAVVRSALEADEGLVAIRYNPAQCACAAFEVRTADGWVRADVAEAEGEGALDSFLADAEADAAAGAVTEYRVRVSLVTSDPSFCQNRVPYVLLRLEGE